MSTLVYVAFTTVQSDHYQTTTTTKKKKNSQKRGNSKYKANYLPIKKKKKKKSKQKNTHYDSISIRFFFSSKENAQDLCVHPI